MKLLTVKNNETRTLQGGDAQFIAEIVFDAWVAECKKQGQPVGTLPDLVKVVEGLTEPSDCGDYTINPIY
jgi:hypothetical protein